MTSAAHERERRGTETQRKTIYLTPYGRDRIEVWAAANGVNFSTAIETLALLGLSDDRAEHLIPALRSVSRQAFQATLDRLARMLMETAVDAAAARQLSEGLLLQQIRLQAQAHPDDFEALMAVSRDNRDVLDARIRKLHDALKASVAKETGKQVRERIRRWSEDDGALARYLRHAEEDAA